MVDSACVWAEIKMVGKVKCLLAQRRFAWGRNNVFITSCNRQKERIQTETQLNME